MMSGCLQGGFCPVCDDPGPCYGCANTGGPSPVRCFSPDCEFIADCRPGEPITDPPTYVKKTHIEKEN